MALERRRPGVLCLRVPGAGRLPDRRHPPGGAFFDDRIGEFLLPYDAVRAAADPDAAVLAFLQSTYEAGADLGGWDRSILEPAELPERPPRRPWSVAR